MITERHIPNSRVREIDAMVDEYLDYREGTLLDSYIAYDKDGELMVVLTTFETSWTSGYVVYTGDGGADDNELWDIWEDFTGEYDSEYPPEGY